MILWDVGPRNIINKLTELVLQDRNIVTGRQSFKKFIFFSIVCVEFRIHTKQMKLKIISKVYFLGFTVIFDWKWEALVSLLN